VTQRWPRLPAWHVAEPGLAIARREVERLVRRAARRRWLVLALALLTAGAVVGARARAPRVHIARVILRVTESSFVPGVARGGRSKKELRSYVAAVGLSHARLLEVIREHGLYRMTAAQDPARAVAAMRGDIEVEVFQNYFISSRSASDAPRSARIAIAYRSPDPKIAMRVARRLAELAMETEADRHRQDARGDSVAAAAAVEMGDKELLDLRKKLAVARAAAEDPHAIPHLMETAGLEAAVARAEGRLRANEARRAEVDLVARAQTEKLGLKFELVEPARKAASGLSPKAKLALTGLAVFLIALPFSAVAIGAFGRRVYTGDDVKRLGVPFLGRISFLRRPSTET